MAVMGKTTNQPLWRIYGFATLATLLIFSLITYRSGSQDLIKVLILAALEITFSFDNAVVNAKILQRMSRFWQTVFMTVGIAIAVFGVRIVLPILMVAFTAHLGAGEVYKLATNDPTKYSEHLLTAHPLIAGFGGMFLLMIFLDFILQDRKIKWLKRTEEILAKFGRLEGIAVLSSLIILLTVSYRFAHGHEQAEVMTAGLIGIITYLAINSLDTLFSHGKLEAKTAQQTFKAGLVGFLYLELIDASFSLDGVIGAFAITNKVLLIAAGLCIGALYVRAMTVHMLRRGMLAKYRYMEHGAHYAIGILALLMLASIRYHIPDFVAGLTGIIFISTAILQSYLDARRDSVKNTSL
jgi:hypothetical protein